MMKHTPGPYVARINKNPKVHSSAATIVRKASDHTDILADVYDPENVPLFLAAPDLLEACQSALDHWYTDGSLGNGSEIDGAVAQMLQTALAKARGEA